MAFFSIFDSNLFWKMYNKMKEIKQADQVRVQWGLLWHYVTDVVTIIMDHVLEYVIDIILLIVIIRNIIIFNILGNNEQSLW